jgi:hypothetical protein
MSILSRLTPFENLNFYPHHYNMAFAFSRILCPHVFIGNYSPLTPKKNLRLFWRTIRVYQVPLLIPNGLASAFTPRELSILTIIRTRTACLGYTNQTTLPFVVFDYGGLACPTTANKVSHFRRSKVTRLAAIHLCYAYHSFRFLPP